MNVKLISHMPLINIVRAARKCHASEGRSDSLATRDIPASYTALGPKDKKLIQDVIIGRGHTSVLEHMLYTFDIDGLSRAALQELARHRHASLSVKSTRYTLKEVQRQVAGKPNEWEAGLADMLVKTVDDGINELAYEQLRALGLALVTEGNIPNDIAKFALPESFKTSLIWSINARSLRNFLRLRTSKAALWEMRELAYRVYDQLPDSHKFLVDDCVEEGRPNE